MSLDSSKPIFGRNLRSELRMFDEPRVKPKVTVLDEDAAGRIDVKAKMSVINLLAKTGWVNKEPLATSQVIMKKRMHVK